MIFDIIKKDEKMKTIDIIVPCYNEAKGLKIFVETTNSYIEKINGYQFKYILVDDGSYDKTLSIMLQLADQYENIKYISFSRNFGKEAAMFAGLKNSDGDYVIVMDADLQHPPEIIEKMIKGIEEGYDCCAAMRITRTGESKIRSFFSKNFYKLSNKITNTTIPYGAVDFRIMSRQMVNAVLSLSEVQRFSKGIFNWVGFKTKWLPYENVERTVGTTKWSLWGLFKYAIDGITAFSVAPLRFISILGITISSLAFIYAIIILTQTLIFGIKVPGYATTIIITLFLGGVIEFSVGILGEYIGRIYIESKGRPIYITKTSNLVNDSTENNK